MLVDLSTREMDVLEAVLRNFRPSDIGKRPYKNIELVDTEIYDLLDKIAASKEESIENGDFG